MEKNIKYWICTETGTQEFLNKEKAIGKFKKLEANGVEAALYEGETFLMKTDFTNNLI